MSIKTIKFVGDMGDRESITQNGVLFHKDEAVTVDSDKVDLWPWFEGNPAFVIEGDDNSPVASNSPADDASKADADADDTDVERAQLMTKLDELEIAYRKNASIETLRNAVAGLEKAGAVVK